MSYTVVTPNFKWVKMVRMSKACVFLVPFWLVALSVFLCQVLKGEQLQVSVFPLGCSMC